MSHGNRDSIQEKACAAVSFRAILADDRLMQLWTEDLSKSTPDDISKSHGENRAWYKEIRRRANAMVESRLAKEMGHEEYTAQRKVSNADVVECERRARILVTEIAIRDQRVRSSLLR